ncbi:NAD-dependent epimerase/dehydratase family protein [Thalassospiraceae bacterium LMO-JJ14]|nr:NAD-dependent epimerase/dehydratase family protein [Thalassospiraceae bacterium LMO-JJ14]
MKIGVTGANGFVGGYLLAALKAAGHDVRALVRTPENLPLADADSVSAIPSIDRNTDIEALKAAMSGLDAVVHLAARVHVMNASLDDDTFHNVNVDGSARLFDAAVAAGIKRFVLISSVKAAGERSGVRPLISDDAPVPEDAYGRSKLAAEIRLREMAADRACELVILRPAFVYGWPPAGNFRAVISAVLKGFPLPLAGIENRRDMTYAGNLADAIATACTAPELHDTPYFISDGVPVSTPELFQAVAAAFGRPARLFHVPRWVLRLIGALTGRSAAISRLTGNFLVDTAPFHRDARWQAPYKMSEGLGAVAQAWRETNRAGPV